MKKKFFLIDSTLYIYKSYYIVNYKKKIFNHKESCYIFLNMIYSKYKLYNPDYIFFIFDYSRKSFRNELYKNYKSNRSPISSDLLLYIRKIKKFLFFLGVKILSLPLFEGDDIIASLVYKINSFFFNNCNIYILSYDKDFLQLVNKNVYLLVNKNIVFNCKNVFYKYGIYPKLIKDLFVLCGDKSDNIPGIKGIGLKKASYLLNKIGGINIIYKNLNKIKLLNISNSNFIINNIKNNFDNLKL